MQVRFLLTEEELRLIEASLNTRWLDNSKSAIPRSDEQEDILVLLQRVTKTLDFFNRGEKQLKTDKGIPHERLS